MEPSAVQPVMALSRLVVVVALLYIQPTSPESVKTISFNSEKTDRFNVPISVDER